MSDVVRSRCSQKLVMFKMNMALVYMTENKTSTVRLI